MKQRLADLSDRRLKLLEKIEAQRMEVAEISVDFQKPLTLADTALKVVRFSRHHRVLVSGGLAALLSIRGMGSAVLVKKVWRLMYLYPAAISLGLKYLFPGIRSGRETSNDEVDHSQE